MWLRVRTGDVSIVRLDSSFSRFSLSEDRRFDCLIESQREAAQYM